MARNSLYCFFRTFASGSLPETVSPVQSTKATDLSRWTSAKIVPGMGGCGQLELAGRLSPAMTKVKLFGSEGLDRLPVCGRGESLGIWPNTAVQSWINKASKKQSISLARLTDFPFVLQENSSRECTPLEQAKERTIAQLLGAIRSLVPFGTRNLTSFYLQRIGNHVNILQPGTGVEKHNFVCGLQEFLFQQNFVSGK